jgi:CRISPR-associated protein Cmr4
MTPRLLFLHALSPLHAGTGQSIGAIDLAIARDRASNFPYLPGSSIKGALRARAHEGKQALKVDVFGPETANASDHSGSLLFGDASLLLLPVRSVAGTFAWVTSPLLLHRYLRDAREAGLTGAPPRVPSPKSLKECLTVDTTLHVDKRVIFEDLDFAADTSNPSVKAFADHLGATLFAGLPDWAGLLTQRFCVVHDDAMAFLAEHATDVVTRVSIDPERKTARDGQLWTEENLPTESVLVSLVAAMGNGRATPDDSFKLLRELSKTPLQLGGKATVGRGRCRLALTDGGAR